MKDVLATLICGRKEVYILDLNEPILTTIRKTVGLNADDISFDAELKMFINMAIGKLNQNGVGLSLVVVDSETWDDLKDPLQVDGNLLFSLVPTFIMLDTKMLFDPPPPSSLQYHSTCRDELLWRLKVQYEPQEVDSNA